MNDRRSDDPPRDAALARALREELALGSAFQRERQERQVRAIMSEVERRAAGPWWESAGRWSRAMVPLGLAAAATIAVLAFHPPPSAWSDTRAASPETATLAAVVAATAPPGEIVDALVPTSTDQLLIAAVAR